MAFGQDTVSGGRLQLRHSIMLGYGVLTTDYLLDGYHPGRPTEFDYNNKSDYGTVSLSYSYHVTPHLSVGMCVTVEQQNGEWLDNELPDGNVFELQTSPKGLFNRASYTVASEVRWDYFKMELFRTYTILGMGRTMERETDQYYPSFYNSGYNNGINNYGPMRQTISRSHVNFYYSPVGISVGRTLQYFFDFGFGYKGVFHTGLSYNMFRK